MARFGPFCLGLLCAILLSAVCHGALEKPPILFGCLPHWSHNEKMLQIAEGLVKKGYPVTFISGALYKENVERIGATYWKLPNAPTTHGFVLPDEDMMELAKLPPDSEELQMHAMGKLILEPMPRNFHTYQEALKQINDPRTIYVHDVAFTGSVPLFFGHAGLRPHTDIGVVPIPVALQSNDTYPWNYGQSPDTTPNSREIHWKANEEFDATYIRAGWNRYADEAFEKLGIPQPPARPAPTIVTFAADIICPLTIPEFDYPRLDVSTDIRYIGMPKSVGTPDRAMPSWWNEVLEARKEGKKIIAVSRSSLDISLEHVLIPTMEALKGREDILMVIALVNSEPESLQGVYDVPKNAHVAKFIPMDLLLPHVDVIVTSAGYGTVQHALRHGVPMVLSGIYEDKAEIGAIGEWAGVAEFHRKINMDAEEVRESVNKILNDDSFKRKARELADVYRAYDPVKRLDAILEERIKWFDAKTAGEKKVNRDEL